MPAGFLPTVNSTAIETLNKILDLQVLLLDQLELPISAGVQAGVAAAIDRGQLRLRFTYEAKPVVVLCELVPADQNAKAVKLFEFHDAHGSC